MLKKKFLFLGLFILQQAQAMDLPMITQKKDPILEKQIYMPGFLKNTIALPIDIKKYILQISHKIHNEFITRVKTSIKDDLPNKYYYKNLKEPRLRQGYVDRASVAIGLCPNNTHVVAIKEDHLQIVNTKNDSILYTKKLYLPKGQKKQYYEHVALSGDTHTIATIHEERKMLPITSDGIHHFTIVDVITIKNRKTKKTESIPIPIDFQIASSQYRSPEFAFNEEGTLLMLRGIDGEQEQICSCDPETECDVICQDMPHHLIIPVTINKIHLSQWQLFALIMKGALLGNAQQESKKKK